MGKLVYSLTALALTGCGTTPPLPTTPCPSEPVVAMKRPEVQACTLRPEIVNLDMDTALAMVRACHEVDMALLIETEKRRREAAEWIKVCLK